MWMDVTMAMVTILDLLLTVVIESGDCLAPETELASAEDASEYCVTGLVGVPSRGSRAAA